MYILIIVMTVITCVICACLDVAVPTSCSSRCIICSSSVSPPVLASIHYFMQISSPAPVPFSSFSWQHCHVSCIHLPHSQPNSQNMIIIQKDLFMANTCSLYSYFGAKKPNKNNIGNLYLFIKTLLDSFEL